MNYITFGNGAIFDRGRIECARPLEDIYLNSNNSFFTGRVGIGTAPGALADITTKLFVEGAISARKIKVDQSSWADFVFDKDYKLP